MSRPKRIKLNKQQLHFLRQAIRLYCYRTMILATEDVGWNGVDIVPWVDLPVLDHGRCETCTVVGVETVSVTRVDEDTYTVVLSLGGDVDSYDNPRIRVQIDEDRLVIL